MALKLNYVYENKKKNFKNFCGYLGIITFKQHVPHFGFQITHLIVIKIEYEPKSHN